MNSIRSSQRALAYFLVWLVALGSLGCYSRRKMQSSQLADMQNIQKLEFVLVNPSAPISSLWKLSNLKFEKETLTARIDHANVAFGKRIATIHSNHDLRASKNLVLIYTSPEVANTLPDTTTAVLNYKEITKIEVFKPDAAKLLAGALIFVGISVGIGAAISSSLTEDAIGASTSFCNCPHVYAETPDGPVELEGSLYGGAIYPQLERTDYLPLKHLQAIGNQYKIRLVNQESQHQFSNLVALEVLDHAPGLSPVFDQYGQLYTIAAPQAPLTATDVSGKDVMQEVLSEDGQVFLGDLNNPNSDATEKLTLQFAKPVGARQAKLLLNAKNSRWLDYTYFEFKDALGEYADKVDRKYRRLPAARSLEWAEKQKMYLGVWLETSPGHWEKSDHFQLPGGSTFRNLVLPLDLSKVAGGEIRIRLEFGFHFWEIDRAALDFSEDQPVQQTTLRPLIATDDTGKDVTAALLEDDDRYYEQPEIGDEASVRFDAPTLADGLERSLVLRARGHYKVLYQNAPGKPGLFKLKSWEKENALPRLSRQRWLELNTFVKH